MSRVDYLGALHAPAVRAITMSAWLAGAQMSWFVLP